jgi:pseudouridine-5'-monophosphatase
VSSDDNDHRAVLHAASGVLFDMDGVLLDTEPLYTVAYDHILAPFGHHLDRATKLEVMGLKAIESAAHVINKFDIPLTPEEFLERRTPVLLDLFHNVKAMNGAEELVSSLQNRGVFTAVATSSHRDILGLKTELHPWFDRFDAIVCGDDPEVANPKPAPDIFIAAAQKLGLDASTCCAFEDSPSGAIAARASGARTFALVPDPDERTRFPSDCLFLASLTELL